MHRTTKVLIIAVLLGVLAGACATESEADVTRRRLAVTVADSQAAVYELVDLGKKGFGPADQFVEHAPLIDADEETIGDSFTTVTMVDGTSDQDFVGLIDCHITVARGTLLFNGSVASKDFGKGITIPVIGGTGIYAGAGGSVKMVVPDAKETNLTFDLLIPRTS